MVRKVFEGRNDLVVKPRACAQGTCQNFDCTWATHPHDLPEGPTIDLQTQCEGPHIDGQRTIHPQQVTQEPQPGRPPTNVQDSLQELAYHGRVVRPSNRLTDRTPDPMHTQLRDGPRGPASNQRVRRPQVASEPRSIFLVIHSSEYHDRTRSCPQIVRLEESPQLGESALDQLVGGCVPGLYSPDIPASFQEVVSRAIDANMHVIVVGQGVRRVKHRLVGLGDQPSWLMFSLGVLKKGPLYPSGYENPLYLRASAGQHSLDERPGSVEIKVDLPVTYLASEVAVERNQTPRDYLLAAVVHQVEAHVGVPSAIVRYAPRQVSPTSPGQIAHGQYAPACPFGNPGRCLQKQSNHLVHCAVRASAAVLLQDDVMGAFGRQRDAVHHKTAGHRPDG